MAVRAETDSVVLFPGRFQPLHNGHAATLEELHDRFARVVVVIANAHVSHQATQPLTGGERYELFRQLVIARDLSRVDVIPVSENHLFTTWVPAVRAVAPRYDVVYTGNPRAAVWFEHWQDELVTVGTPRTPTGTEVRKALLGEGRSWTELVPNEIQPLLRELGVARRLRLIMSDTD